MGDINLLVHRREVLMEKSARVKWVRPNLSLERNNRSEQSPLASRSCKPRYVRWSLYEKWGIEGILLVYMRLYSF